MSVSEEYREYIIECLERVIPVSWRKMFGGIGIYHEETFFALAAGNSLFFKVDDSNRSDYERAGMEPFRPYKKKSYSMSYYEVPADVLEDNTAFANWVNKVVAAAQAGKKPTRRKKRKTS